MQKEKEIFDVVIEETKSSLPENYRPSLQNKTKEKDKAESFLALLTVALLALFIFLLIAYAAVSFLKVLLDSAIFVIPAAILAILIFGALARMFSSSSSKQNTCCCNRGVEVDIHIKAG